MRRPCWRPNASAWRTASSASRWEVSRRGGRRLGGNRSRDSVGDAAIPPARAAVSAPTARRPPGDSVLRPVEGIAPAIPPATRFRRRRDSAGEGCDSAPTARRPPGDSVLRAGGGNRSCDSAGDAIPPATRFRGSCVSAPTARRPPGDSVLRAGGGNRSCDSAATVPPARDSAGEPTAPTARRPPGDSVLRPRGGNRSCDSVGDAIPSATPAIPRARAAVSAPTARRPPGDSVLRPVEGIAPAIPSATRFRRRRPRFRGRGLRFRRRRRGALQAIPFCDRWRESLLRFRRRRDSVGDAGFRGRGLRFRRRRRGALQAIPFCDRWRESLLRFRRRRDSVGDARDSAGEGCGFGADGAAPSRRFRSATGGGNRSCDSVGDAIPSATPDSAGRLRFRAPTARRPPGDPVLRAGGGNRSCDSVGDGSVGEPDSAAACCGSAPTARRPPGDSVLRPVEGIAPAIPSATRFRRRRPRFRGRGLRFRRRRRGALQAIPFCDRWRESLLRFRRRRDSVGDAPGNQARLSPRRIPSFDHPALERRGLHAQQFGRAAAPAHPPGGAVEDRADVRGLDVRDLQALLLRRQTLRPAGR